MTALSLSTMVLIVVDAPVPFSANVNNHTLLVITAEVTHNSMITIGNPIIYGNFS
jgi:hypothetical protein